MTGRSRVSFSSAWVRIAGLCLASLLAFAKVAEDVLEHESGPFDDAVRGWVLAHQAGGARLAALWITNAAAPAPMVVLSLLLAAWLWQRKHRPAAAVLLLAPTVALTIFESLKFTVRRLRPPGAELLHIRTFAFPSGHVTTGTVILGSCAYLLAREGIVSRGSALTIGLVGPVLIGLTRVYLDVHWATDVLAGWATGGLVVALGIAGYELLLRERSPHGRGVQRELTGPIGRADAHGTRTP